MLIQCAGVRGAFTIDDAFTAGRYVAELHAHLPEWELTDGSTAALRLADGFDSSVAELAASQTLATWWPPTSKPTSPTARPKACSTWCRASRRSSTASR